ncbi:MAG: hypothetical protein A2096_14210, partial [Spirochaetes bacterium GWF1_41_5]
MIITKIIGGLGNQLFQYAAGRAMAINNRTELLLDITPFKEYKLHKYSLMHFNINENFPQPKHISRFLPTGRKRFFRRFSFFPQKSSSYICEQGMGFHPEIAGLKKNEFYLDGFWQSEKYFLSIAPLIRNEFKIITPANTANLLAAEKINACNSVSLHIRRMDYVNNADTNLIHGLCSMSYYNQAVFYILNTIPDANFFIFSDDIDWAKQNLKISSPCTFIDFNNADTNYEDLRLMSQCRHNIIANSSFSWWGAWLNDNPGK